MSGKKHLSVFDGMSVADDFERLADFIAAERNSVLTNKILDYRRIQPWENYFLCSAICSVGKALGSPHDDYHFYANFTGDNFACLYSAAEGNPSGLQCDSGLSNYFMLPEVIKRAFEVSGYECIYVSSEHIAEAPEDVMRAIRVSIDRQIPVLSCGIGNVTMRGSTCRSPLPEACLIGGYAADGALYVNLYPGQERLPDGSLDEYGYSTIYDGLSASQGLFFTGDRLTAPDMHKNYQHAIAMIPEFMSGIRENSAGERYAFGRDAFDIWAATLENDSYFDGLTDAELEGACWNLHCSPYCCICTSAAPGFLRSAAELYPDIEIAGRLLPLYERMQLLRQEIWDYQEGFFPSMANFRRNDFRAHIAAILRAMGGICEEICSPFSA